MKIPFALTCSLSFAFLATAFAAEPRITFSMRADANCPTAIAAITPSKDYGIQKVTIRNDSLRKIRALSMKVSLVSESGEEIIDGAGFAVEIEPDGRVPVEAGLGEIRRLREIAKASGESWIRAVVYVDAVYFEDGQRWEQGAAAPPDSKPA